MMISGWLRRLWLGVGGRRRAGSLRVGGGRGDRRIARDRRWRQQTGQLFEAVTQIQSLEDRSLLAVSSLLHEGSGLLEIDLNAKGDAATVSVSGSSIVVEGKSYTATAVQSIQVNGDNSDDQDVNFNGTVVLSGSLTVSSVTTAKIRGIYTVSGDVDIETQKAITLASGSQLLVTGDVTLTARDHGFIPSPVVRITEKDAGITLDGARLVGRNVSLTADADGANLFDDDSAASMFEPVIDFLTGLSIVGGVALCDANAEIRIDSGSSIVADQLTLDAVAKTQATMLTSSFYVGIAYGQSSPKATISVGQADITTSGDFRLNSQADSVLSIAAQQAVLGPTLSDRSVDITLAAAYSTIEAVAKLGEESNVIVGGSLDVIAETQRDHSVLASAGSYQDGTLGLAAAVSVSDLTNTAAVDGRATVGGQVNILANTETTRNDTAADASVGLDIATKWISAAKGPLANDLAGRLLASKKTDNRGGGSGSLDFAGAFSMAVHSSQVTARIGDGAEVTSTGSQIVVDALLTEMPEISAYGAVSVNTTEGGNRAKNAGAVGITVGEFTNRADALIGENADVDALQGVDVAAEVRLPYEIQWLQLTSIKDVTDKLNSNLGIQNGFFTSWAQATGQAENTSVSGSAAYLEVTNTANATIAAGAQVNQDETYHSDEQDVTVSARNDVETVNFSGIFSLFGAGNTAGQNGVGGSYLQTQYNNTAEAQIEANAAVYGDSLFLRADNFVRNVSIAVAGGKAGKLAFNGSFSVAGVDNTSLAQIDTAARVTTGAGTVEIPREFNDLLGNDNLHNGTELLTEPAGTHRKFESSDVDSATDTINNISDFSLGQQVQYYKPNGGDSVDGLTHGQVYYAIPQVDLDFPYIASIQLATTKKNALDRVAIDIDASVAGDGNHRLVEPDNEFKPTRDVVSGLNTIAFPDGHGLGQGDEVRYFNGGGTTVGGLTNGETYYVITSEVDPTLGVESIKLATTLANAQAGVFVNLDGTNSDGDDHRLLSPESLDADIERYLLELDSNGDGKLTTDGDDAITATNPGSYSTNLNMLVVAEDEVEIYNIVGGITKAGNAGAGVSIAVDDIRRDTRALVGDKADHGPVAQIDTAELLASSPDTNINVLANDDGLDDGPVAVSIVAQPLYGSVVVNADNTITYTPAGALQADNFYYQVMDADGDLDTAEVAVGPADTATPKAVADTVTTSEDASITFDVLFNDTGLDDAPLVLAVTTAPSHGTVLVNTGDTLTYVPNADFVGTDSFTYQVTDADGETASATVNVTVTAVSTSLAAANDSASTNEDTQVSIAVLGNDTGTNLQVAVRTEPANGTVVLDNNTFTYTPNADFVGTDTFVYELENNDGNVDTGIVTVTVNSVDDVPYVSDDDADVEYGAATTIDVLANDTGLGDGPLAVTFPPQTEHGMLTLNSDNTITYTPDAGYSGEDSFEYMVTDGDLDAVTATVSVTVKTASALRARPDVAIVVDAATTIDVLGNDLGLQNTPLTLTLITAPSHGTVMISADNTIKYAPGAGYAGSDSFVYQIEDATVATSTATVTVTNGVGFVMVGGTARFGANNRGLIGSGALAAAVASIEDPGATTPSGRSAITDPTEAFGGQSKTTWGFAVSGAVTANNIADTTEAAIRDGHVSATDPTTSPSSLQISARNNSQIISVAGGIAASLGFDNSFGLAGSATQNKIQTTTRALVENSNVTNLGLAIDADNAATIIGIAASGSGAAGSQKSAALAGSVAINQISTHTTAGIRDGAVVDGATSVRVDADNSSQVTAVAGAAAFGGNVGFGAGLGLNFIDDETTAEIDSSDVSAIGDVRVWATTDATIDAVSAALAVAMDKPVFAAAFSISVNELQDGDDSGSSSGTFARISGKKSIGVRTTGTGAIMLKAKDESEINSGAGAVGASVGKGTGFGASTAWNCIDRDVKASVDDGAVLNSASTIDVSATSDAQIINVTAAGAGSESVALGGAVSLNRVRNRTVAHVADSSATADSNIHLTARDESEIDSGAGTVVASTGNAALGAAAADNDIANTIKAFVNRSTLTSTNDSILLQADSDGTIKTFSIGIGGSNSVGVAGSVSTNRMATKVIASIANSTVTANDNVGALADQDNVILSGSGALAGGKTLGLGGSVTVNTLDNVTRAFVSSSTVLAKGVGGGVTVKNWNPKNGNESIESIRGLAVIASNTETINNGSETFALGVSGSFAANVIVTTLEDTTEAYITNSTVNSTSQPGQWVVVRAHQSTDVTSYSGGHAGSATAGFGAASDTTTVNNTVRAFIADNHSELFGTNRVEGLAGVDVLAVNYEDIASYASAGALTGNYALAGSVSVVKTDSTTHAYISDARVKTDGSLKVRAGSTTDVNMIAGALSVGLAGGGVGGSVAYVQIANTTKADITDSTTDARLETLVQAQSTEDVYTVAATFGGGQFVGLAGAVTITLMVADTRAFIGSSSSTKKSKINQNSDDATNLPDVTVLASDDATIQDRSGGESAGLGSVGAAVDVASIRNDVSAFIGSHSLVTAGGGLEVKADGNKTIVSEVIAESVGGVGIAGSVSVLSVGSGIDSEGKGYVTADALSKTDESTGESTDDAVSTSTTQHGTTAFIGSLATVTADSVTVSADDEVTIASATGSGSGGAVGVGASVASIKQSQFTSAYVDDQASVSATAGDISVRATLTKDELTATAFSEAAGLGASNNQISKIGDGSSQSAYIDAGAKIPQAGNVTIAASANRELLADSPGGGIGGISIGISKADARITGSTKAYIGANVQIGQTSGQTVGSLSVSASADNDVTARSLAINLGAVATIGVSEGTAKIDDNIQAVIGADADITVTGSVDVRAASLADADAQMTAVSVAQVSVGVVTTTATITPNVAAFVDSSATVKSTGTGTSAGNLSVQAFHNYSTGTTPAALTDYDATANANAPSVAIAAGSGAVPTATSSATVQSYVGRDTTLSAGGAITIASRSYNDASADANALTVGLSLGVGVSLATATAGAADTTAHLDGTVSGASQLNVLTETLHVARAEADATGGGLFAGNGAVATASIPQSTNIRAYLGNNASVTATGNILIQSNSETDAGADVFSKIGGLVAVGKVNADASIKPNIKTYVGNNASVTSTEGQIALHSLHNYTTGSGVISGRNATANADAASGGVGADIGTKAAATSNASVETWAGTGAKLDAFTDIRVSTWSNNEAHADADGEANGVVSKGGATADAIANGITRSILDNVASVNAGADFKVTAIATNTANADADGTANGFSGDAGAKATATGAPVVAVSVDSSGSISTGDDAYLVAQSRGNVTSHADTASSGLAASGDPHAFANWNPTVTATVGAGTALQAGDGITLHALHNFSESKDPDESRYVKAVADAKGRAYASDLNPEATVNTDVTVLANVGAGAQLTAVNEIAVFAVSYNKAEAFADGDSTSVEGKGSIEATANMASDVQAKTDDASDASDASPTVLEAGTKISFVSFAFNATSHPVLNSENKLDITADVKATSTMKNLGGSILGKAVVNLTNPVSLARLGNSTQIQAPNAEVRVESSNNASLVAKTEVKQTGQVGEVDAKTNVTLSDSRTQAEVGSNADVKARKFTLKAYDDDDGLFTPKVGTLAFSGGNFVIAPADIDLPNGVINLPGISVIPSADSTVDMKTTTSAKIAAGSSITAREQISIESGSESNRSRAHAETSGNGNGTLRTDANNYKVVNAVIVTEAGSMLTSQIVSVIASRPEVVGGTQYEKHSKVASANKKLEDTSGTEKLQNYVRLDSNITALGGSDAYLTVDSTGKVTAIKGVTATDGTSTSKLAVGNVVSQAIVVQDVTSTSSSQINVQAPNGSLYGHSNVYYGTEFGKLTITNESSKNLFIDKIDSNDNNASQTISVDATTKSWTRTVSKDVTPGADIEIRNRSSADVTLRGCILNPEGTTTIHNAGGDIFQSGGSISAASGVINVSGGSIITRQLELTADMGAIGTSAGKIPVLFVAGAAWKFGFEKVSGNQGVALDVLYRTDDVTVPTLTMTDLTSTAGDIEVNVRDARQLAGTLYVTADSTVQFGANVIAAKSLLLSVGAAKTTNLDQTAAFTAGALGVRATGRINLASNLNNVTGSVALNSTGGGKTVSLRNNGTITLGSLSVGSTPVNGVSTTGGVILSGGVILTSENGAIRDIGSDTGIVGKTVILTAKTGIGESIGNPLDTAATFLDVSVTGSGSIFLNELNDVSLTDVDTFNGAIVISSDAMIATDVQSLTDLDANDISLTARMGNLTVGVVTAKNVGDVNLTATTGSILDNVGDSLTDVGGDVVKLIAATGIGQSTGTGSLDTNANILFASVTGIGLINLDEFNAVILSAVSTVNGDITISAGGTTLATSVQSLTNSDTNDITLTARAGDLTVGSVTAGAGTLGDVSLTATSGSIRDDGLILGEGRTSNDFIVDIVGDLVTLTAQKGVGEIGMASGSLDTNANTLDVSVTGSGPISLSEFDSVTLSAVDTVNGPMKIFSGKAMTATKVISSTNDADNDILLRATTENLTVGSVKVGSNSDVTLEAVAGGIVDDINDPVSDVTGDVVTLIGKSVGESGGNGTIDVTAREVKTNAPTGVVTYVTQSSLIASTTHNEAPTELTLSSLHFTEQQTTVGMLSTTDPDSGNTHSYFLVAGPGDIDNGYFAIDGNTLKVVGELNKASFSIRVRTLDQGGRDFDEVFTLILDDDDHDAPIITLGGSSGTENDLQAQGFSWIVTDDVGLGAIVVAVKKDGITIFSSSSAIGAFNFDSQTLGEFEISVNATDSDVDRAGDALTSTATRTVTVTDNTLSISSPTVTEGTGGTKLMTFEVTSPKSAPGGFTVAFTAVNGTATNSDYKVMTLSPLTFTGAAGEIQTITFSITTDSLPELNEQFTVLLGAVDGTTTAIVTGMIGTGTITEDDPGVSITVSPTNVLEKGRPNLVYTFTRSGPTSEAVTVKFDVSGTATFASDYTQAGALTFGSTAGTIYFAKDVTTKTLTIDPLDDTTIEGDETVILTVKSGTGYSATTLKKATGTITNDDMSAILVTVNRGSVSENGTTNLVYTFTRTHTSSQTPALTASFSVGGTATLNTDYALGGATSFSANTGTGTVKFAAGATKTTIIIDPSDNSTNEPHESVILTVTAGNGYIAGRSNSAIANITDNDPPPSLSISDAATVTEPSSGTVIATFQVTLSAASEFTVTVAYATANDTAVASGDYETTNGTLTFTPGQNSKTIQIRVKADTVPESTETFQVKLTNPIHVLFSDSTALGTILNNP